MAGSFRNILLIATGLTMMGLSACSFQSHKSALDAGIAQLEQKQYKKASRILEKAAFKNPADASTCCNLGIAYWKLGVTNSAVEQFQKAAALAPDDPRPLEFLAAVHRDNGAWVEARDALSQAYHRMPLSPRILTAMAAIDLQLKGSDAALLWLKQALAVAPNYSPALYNMALLQRDWLNNSAAAKPYFERFLKVAATDVHAESVRKELQGGVRRMKVAATAADSSESGANAILTQIHTAIARETYDTALVQLKQGINRYPSNPDLLWELASLYDRYLENSAMATATYRDFMARFPKDRRLSEARARIRIREAGDSGPGNGKSKGASGLRFKTAENRDPIAAQDAYNRGLQFYQRHDWNRAIYYFTQAIENDPALVNAYFNLGLSYKSNDEIENARDAFAHAVELQPGTVNARYMLALMLRQLNLFEEAIFQLSQILAVQPNHADAHLALGLVYHQSGNRPLAQQHLSRYLELAPNGSSAEEVRRLLKPRR